MSSSAWRPCMGHRGWVGVVRTKGCSHHSCRYRDVALLCHEGSEVGWERDSKRKGTGKKQLASQFDTMTHQAWVPEPVLLPCSTALALCSTLSRLAFTSLHFKVPWVPVSVSGSGANSKGKANKVKGKSKTKPAEKSSHATLCFQVNETNSLIA